ncbi:MAG: hypothetical protein AAFY20_09645 [Cyanobacteria bacterium J06639_14]
MQSLFSFSQLSNISLALAILLGLTLSANAQTLQNIDAAPNDRFSDRITIEADEAGAIRLVGQLDAPDPSEFIYETTATLIPGQVDTFTISDLPPSQPLLIFMEMESDQATAVLGLYDTDDNLVTLGYGYYSSAFNPYPTVINAVPASGTIQLKVSGQGDDNFDGNIEYYDYYTYCENPEGCEPFAVAPHGQTGEYTISMLVGHAETQGDIDFFTISGLTPGHVFTVAESAFEYGLKIGWMADDGTVIARSSYLETGREQLGGIVPASGEVHLVVTAYEDYDFQGGHTLSGDYLLEVETRPQ